ncbi:hypothetical protein [Listeria monocytogenes]|uniref:hypothetical protein n=1 Tax=Listeria monocytogenes TaxID=1639 RepID=UPI0010E7767C|nr:hypothetical protein [Listeria monocytogenes]EAC7121854.1 hypothetical protein [Listeria monocytogenes]EAD8923961.1 hypothetical protein [Listeria monocytogenes]EAD8999296.1 hypothetical protein [Listeria monocytogenes]EAD9004562.1 hypothetical protein [Listeria monocytogenes]EAK9531233.1 hypothetical protein [Listeria monocytogenes]
MNFKVGDRVTWSNYKIANGKIINISDYRPQTMKYAVDFGFNDLVFCGQDDIILLNPAEELEIEQSDIDSDICSKYKKADVCKECDETFTQYDAENYAWALEHLRDEGEITVVYVQRWLRISYDRATKICNRLVEEGIAEVHNGIYVLEGEA